MSDDRYSKLLAQRQAKTQPEIAKQKTLDGRDGQIAQRLKSDGSEPMTGPLVLSSDHPPQAGGNIVRSAAAPAGWVDERIQEHGHGQYVTNNEFMQFKKRLDEERTSEDGGGQHTHKTVTSFTPFVNYPKEVRKAMLADRWQLELALDSGKLDAVQATIAQNTLHSLKLRQDYRDFDAYERERRLEDPAWAEWADKYKRVFGIDEYGEVERPNYLPYPELGVRMDPYQGIAPLEDQEGHSQGGSLDREDGT